MANRVLTWGGHSPIVERPMKLGCQPRIVDSLDIDLFFCWGYLISWNHPIKNWFSWPKCCPSLTWRRNHFPAKWLISFSRSLQKPWLVDDQFGDYRGLYYPLYIGDYNTPRTGNIYIYIYVYIGDYNLIQERGNPDINFKQFWMEW